VYRLIISAVGALAICVFAWGCGSSGEDTATAQVTKTEYVKQAKAICEKVGKKMEAAALAWPKAHGGKELDFDTSLKAIIGPTLEQEAEELRTLAPPEGGEEKVSRMVNHLARGAAAYTREGAELKSVADIRAFQQEAKPYGLQACWV